MKNSRRQSGKRSRSTTQSGNVLLEFALSALLLTSVFTGTFQFGYTFYVYNKLVTAVSAAGRYGSLHPLTNSNNTAVPTSFANDVKNMAVYGTPTPVSGSRPVAPGLTTANIDVVVNFAASGTGFRPTEVRVKVVNYQMNAIFRTFSFSNRPSITIPYFGSYCPDPTVCS
ncbi:MAG TPA: TadE/TadG family type IV pilus assembly protein [Bryobacteraceae bacterium]|nr:TadE/TadG family type IV pilus assembly protein [Bryobacteraceae bacterium]